jgi:hypothetical protein
LYKVEYNSCYWYGQWVPHQTWLIVKWILKYLKGTINFSLIMIWIHDANMVGDVDFIKSTTGHIMTLQGEWFYGNQGCKNMLHYLV